jgi:hypothetical protein
MEFHRIAGKKKKQSNGSIEIGAPSIGITARRQVHAPDEDLEPGIWTPNSKLCQ